MMKGETIWDKRKGEKMKEFYKELEILRNMMRRALEIGRGGTVSGKEKGSLGRGSR